MRIRKAIREGYSTFIERMKGQTQRVFQAWNAVSIVFVCALVAAGYTYSRHYPVDYVTSALVALAGASSVLFAGGLIFRQLNPVLTDSMRGAFTFLGFGVFAPILALIARGPMMLICAILFLLFYIPGAIVSVGNWNAAVRKTLVIPEGTQDADAYRKSFIDFSRLYLVGVAAIVLLVAFPDPRLVAWVAVALDFIAYQIFLGTLFTMIPDMTLPQILLGLAVTVANLTNTLRQASELPPLQGQQLPGNAPAPESRSQQE